MAILEPRLLPLIETLVDVGADWLAFEVVDGVRAGRVPEEPLENLAAIQKAVRSAKLENFRTDKRAAVPVSVRPSVLITGDDQIRWAAEYVFKRVSDTLWLLQASLDQLQSIAPSTSRDGVAPESDTVNGVTVIVQAGEEKFGVQRRGTADAIAVLESLRKALSSWESSARERSGTE